MSAGACIIASPCETKEDVPPPIAKEKRDVCTSFASSPSITKEDVPFKVQQAKAKVLSVVDTDETDSDNESTSGLSQAMKNLELVSFDNSPYVTESTGSSSSGSANDSSIENQTLRRLKLNEFLSVCGRETVNQPKKSWEQLSTRTKNVRVSKAKDAVVASLEVISPGNPAALWEAMKSSQSVEKALGTENQSPLDKKYLEALAETYQNASSWDTRRQVLSIMADLTPYSVLQQFIPGITDYRIKVARQHSIEHGRGVPLPAAKSPRLRVDEIQLDHFLSFITSPHVVQDLPFGQRYLYLSNGKVLETPNVIRSMIPQRIIDQYNQFCLETNFSPFSPSTMLRILSSCTATVRKSLQGLDYFAAEGAKAFNDLLKLVARTGDRQWVVRCEQALKEGKQYLKTDYKVHITRASSIPDHCSAYALTDTKEECLREMCDHAHDKSCPFCDRLKDTLKEIELNLSEANLDEEDRDDVMYSFQQAYTAIEAWKAHQLRSIQQDEARSNIIDTMAESSVLITQDWAMKFLPRKYRETQADWFAKRGISWHISTVVRRKGNLQHQAFVHIVKNCNQDSDAVVSVLRHTLQQLKMDHPETTTAFLRQDNAGCYHSVTMLAACGLMEKATGIKVERVDFSDPQGGKGPCDRKAATIKAHVLRYLNEGHDVVTAEDFRDAMLSHGGVRGVRVALIDISIVRPTSLRGKLEGVSSFNNFHLGDRELTAWKAFDVGKGKKVPWTQLEGARSLAEACLEGDVGAVRKLLEEGWSVHEPTDEGESLLSLACSAGYYELAQVLLAMNANVDDRGSKGDCTPLMEASSGGYIDIVKLLLEHAAVVNLHSQAGNTALIYACCGGYEDVVEELLNHGADIETHNENGHTPLMEAASGGHVNVAKMLLERGACINSHSNEFKESALTLACYKGHLEMVKFLLDAGADQEHKTDEMHTALMEASMDGHVEVAKLLLDHGAQVNMPADSFESPLTLAACGGHVELADLLIKRGAFLEEVNDEGYTPLMEASREGHLDMVALLLEHGADIHAQTEETQETALSLACCGGFQDVAAFLLQAGAAIEQGSSTPLMEAAQEGHVELVRFLLEQGANVNATTATGDTPLSFACENGHTDVADVLLAAGAELEHESEAGRTPLMKAARAGHLCTVQFLISRGADVNRQTTMNDHTVLSLACAGGHLAVVELLLAHGADPLHKLKDNSNILIEAAKGGHAAVICFLLENPVVSNPPELPLQSVPASLPTPMVPPPRVPPVHSTQPPVMEHPDLPDVNETMLEGQQAMLNQLSNAPLSPQSPLLLNAPANFLMPDVPITSCSTSSTMPSVSQSMSDMSTNMTSTAVQTDNKVVICEKLQLIQGKLAKALKNANLSLDNIPPELLQSVNEEVSALNLDGEEIAVPPSPFSMPIGTGGVMRDQDNIEGLMVAEPAQTLHDTIGDMISEDSSNNSSPPTPPELCTPSVPLTPTPSPASPQFPPMIDVDQQTDSNSDTALTLAAAGGHDELVTLLLVKGSDIEHRDKKGCTPLILAATAGHASTVEILMEHRADIEAQSDRTKDTALSLACSGGRQEVVELLIAKGANFEHRNVSDYTPLSLAASGGYVGIIKLLLNHGAEINSRTGSKLGISPLMLASMNGHTAAVKLLLDMGSDINAQIETNRNTALTLACFQGRHEVVNLLVERKANIEHRAKTGLTPLMEAASGGYVEVGRILLDKGGDVNAPPVPSSRDTALTIAADKGHYKFCDLLLSRGAMVDVKNKKGNSPLWLAANGGHLEVCQLLFSYGADVDSQDNRKVSVLMAAFRKGHVKVVKWLVKHVHQFPSDSECTRFVSTLSDKELLNKCHKNMEIIVTAKDRQAAEANKNASILLEELDLEKEREEMKKAAAARKRDKKKQKKKKKLQAEKEAETNVKNMAEKENSDDSSEPERKISENGVDTNVLTPQLSTSAVIDSNSVSGVRTRKSSTGSLDTLTSIAITAAVTTTSSVKSKDVISVMKTAEITKVVATTIMTQTTPHSALSPITVATAAAQCLAVTLTTTTATTKVSTLPSPKKGKRHEDGWKEVVRRSKKMSVSSSVISRVIGRGGCNINAIRETTGAHIDIDTNRQKTTGSCIITIKGPADATRQAHQLIQALVKDPECDINDVLPRKKHLPSPTSRSATATTITTSVTSTVSHHRTLSEPKPNTVKTHSTTHSTQTRTTSKTTTAVSHQSLSNSWPSTSTTPASIRPQVTTSVSNTSAKSAAITSSTHMPSTARWATTTQTAASTNKKAPLAATQVTSTSSHPITAAVSSTTARKMSGGKANVSGSSGSGVVKPPTPAKRQLFPESSSSEVSRQATASKTTRVVKGSPSYSSVAMGVTSSSGTVDGVTPVTTSSPLRAAGSAITSLASSNLPPAISNILSHVGQTLSPSVWNDISHPSVRPNVGPVSDLDHTSSVSPADPITQPLYITTPGALFTPLPHEAPSSSPPNTSGSPVPSTTPTSTSPNSSPLGTSLAPGSTSVVESADKPSLRPIGTERASRRISASPLPSVPGISPLIGTEGTQVAGVWSYSYAPDPTLSTGWSGAPTVSTAPSPPLISGSNSLPGTDEEQFRVNPGDTLQTFLERLSLSSHLGLFQKNEIDLDALLLMSEKDYADIGLPKGPRVKLLNSTRQLYTSDNQEFSAGPPGPSPSTRPVGRTPGWSPQGIIATSSPPTTVAAGVPYGAKRVPGRKVDTNKRGWKSWSRTAV